MDDSNNAAARLQPGKSRHIEQQVAHIMNHEKDVDSPNGSSDLPQTKGIMGLILDFLSTSSNEMLLFVLTCLVVTTYILLGRLGLLLIGVIVGIVLHASWEEPSNNLSSKLQSSNRKQLSLEIVDRILDQQNNTSIRPTYDENNSEAKTVGSESNAELEASTLGPATTAAVRSLIDAVMKDYVNHWYEPILPSESTFPLSCQRTLTSFITSISSHLSRKRTADTFLEFLVNSSSMVIVFLNELSSAFEVVDPTTTPEHAVLHYLESHPESRLSNILENQQQHKKLIMISDDILSRFLDRRAYNCIPLRDFLREVLAGVVFESAISSLSRPEFINGWIIYLFSEGESQLMSAIDAGVEGARTQSATAVNNSREANTPASISADSKVSESSSLRKKIDSKPESGKMDEATEAAMVEVKRLSDMIVAQDLQDFLKPKAQSNMSRVEDGGYQASPAADSNAEKETEEQLSDTKTAQSDLAGKVQGGDDRSLGNSNDSHKHQTSYSSSSLQSMGSLPTSQSLEKATTPPAFTLHRASISVDDGLEPGDKALLRSKPTSNYLLQVEPQYGRSSGWMIFRKYSDFESIHETLGTISRLNQIRQFTDDHPAIPPWKGQTGHALARNLERYLQDALQHEPLAESITMRRFLENDGRLGPEPPGSSAKPGFFFPSQAAFENVGKGVLGVLANAPKGVSGGGKAVFEGVTGVFGAGISKKSRARSNTEDHNKKGEGDVSQKIELPPKTEGTSRNGSSLDQSREEAEAALSFQPSKDHIIHDLELSSGVISTPKLPDTVPQTDNSMGKVTYGTDEIPTDPDLMHSSNITPGLACHPSKTDGEELPTVHRNQTDPPGQIINKGQENPITTDETQLAVELIFAVINELYSLSSAWNIRRTLLNAAKSYILRPGNPSLETIRNLLQESMINSHTSDEAIGLYLAKLRENALPTPEELSSWPADMTDAEKERLRETARRVLVQKGLPQAITSVMGASASREALGKVFDCLQVDTVARGFVFSILLQALRAVVL